MLSAINCQDIQTYDASACLFFRGVVVEVGVGGGGKLCRI